MYSLRVLAHQHLRSAEQLGLQQLQIFIPEPGGAGKQHRRQLAHPMLFRQPLQAVSGTVYQCKQACSVFRQTVGAEGKQHRLRPAQDLFQYPNFLGGKALKGVHRHRSAFKKITGLQPVRQTGQIVSGVEIGSLHQRLIGPIDQSKLRKLFPKPSAANHLCRFSQLLRGNGAQLHLIDRREHQVGNPSAPGRARIDLQMVLAGGDGRRHENAPAAVCQPASRKASLFPEYGLRQTGKAVYLNGRCPNRPRLMQYGLLRFEGILLRHQHHQLFPALPVFFCQQFSEIFGFSASGTAQDKLQQRERLHK